jgi:glycosyltransferase involved in cell wall biosynthesis
MTTIPSEVEDLVIERTEPGRSTKRKVIVVLPAFNAARTLRKTHREVIAYDCVDEVVIVDDASHDDTVEIARTLEKATVIQHPRNLGYGGNQKTCYRAALEMGADIVIMVHPDYQYTPKLIPAMVALIESELYHCVLASRILGGYALKGGMPLWRYVANRVLTFLQNAITGAKLSEYHTGYRAFSAELLGKLPLGENSDDFVFDNQMLAQILWHGYTVAEVSCPTRYSADASSINFRRSIRYGFGCIATTLQFALARRGLIRSGRFPKIRT